MLSKLSDVDRAKVRVQMIQACMGPPPSRTVAGAWVQRIILAAPSLLVPILAVHGELGGQATHICRTPYEVEDVLTTG